MKPVYWLSLLLFCGLCVQSANAANMGNIGRMTFSQNGRVTTLGPPTNAGGSTIPVSPSMGGWTTAGNYGVPTGATGPTAGLNVNGQFIVGGSAGVKYPVSGAYSIPWGSVAAAAAAVVCTVGTAGACGVASVAAAASPYVMDWLGRAGVSRNADTGALEQPQTDGATQSDGYRYWTTFQIDGANPQYFGSANLACQGMSALWTSRNGLALTDVRAGPGTDAGNCLATTPSGSQNYPFTAWNRGVSNCPAGYYVTSFGCYSSSNLPKVAVTVTKLIELLRDVQPDPRVFGDVLSKGGDIDFPNPTVTGPSSVQGPETVKQNPDGSKEVTRTTYNFTTNNNIVTNTSNVTTTTHISASGQTTGTTTVTTTPTETQPGTQQPSEEDESAPVDTPLGDLPKLYERKYPDGIVGIWTEKRQQLNQTQLFQLPQQLMPTGVGGGSCPTFTIPLDFVAFGNFGVGDVSPPCWIYDVLKVIVLIGAAILARALIFGG